MAKQRMSIPEAWEIVRKQVSDYDVWSRAVLDACESKQELCKHPYVYWFNKENEPERSFCLFCHKEVKYPQAGL